jgi:hypothetical protein
MSTGAQNMKTGTDALGNAEKEFERAMPKKSSTPPVQPKMSPGAQNMKKGPDALGTAENMSGSGKHEIGKGRPRYRRKRVRKHKT